MALGGVFMKDTDNNIGSVSSVSNQKVSGLIFDISKQADFYTAGQGLTFKDKLKDNVIEINSMADLEALGITAFTGDKTKDLLYGIPYYHIKHYFDIQGSYGRLFLAFADCSANFDIVSKMQRAAHGVIDHLGVWTEQSLWTLPDANATVYSVALAGDLNNQAKNLADENAPLSILLSANSALIKTTTVDNKQVDLSKIPSCVDDLRYVSILLSQGLDGTVQKMQLANDNATPVGVIGAALGCLSYANIPESIAWTGKFNLINYFPDVEMGFGDVTASGDPKAFASTLKYSSMAKPQFDTLDDKGYIFLCKYSGIENGVYFSKDHTCSKNDYRTIARNRAINKSRRLVRTALLPYVNAPLLLNPTTGTLSSAQITTFTNIVNDILKAMVTGEEISGYVPASIDATQNLLKSDNLIIKYSIVPVGVGSQIDVVEGLALTNK